MCQSSVVDAMRLASKARWLNQSKGADANCSSYVYWVRGDPRIAIFAKRDVRAGEELCFDYGAVFQRENGKRSRSPDAVRPLSPSTSASSSGGPAQERAGSAPLAAAALGPPRDKRRKADAQPSS